MERWNNIRCLFPLELFLQEFCPVHYDKKKEWGLTTRKEEMKLLLIVDMIGFWKTQDYQN